MKTTKEMIEVMQAFERGEKIEWRRHNLEWEPIKSAPVWDWGLNDYRIAKPAPKKVKLLAYIISGEIRMFTEDFVNLGNFPRVPSLDKEVEIEE